MKKHKGRVSKIPVIRPFDCIGELAIISTNYARIDEAQIKSFILTLKRLIPGGVILPRIFAYLPVSKKPSEVRMGKGKGSINTYVARVRPNTVLFEINKVPLGFSIASLKTVSTKLGIQSQIISVGKKSAL
jgi:large subunit ribosomal protein L16